MKKLMAIIFINIFLYNQYNKKLMNIPSPEKRRCEKCLNTMTLNLFRLNSLECRYCEDNLAIPKKIISENQISMERPRDSEEMNQNVSYPSENINQEAIEMLSDKKQGDAHDGMTIDLS